MRVDTRPPEVRTLIAIEIRYTQKTRTTAFAAKRHSIYIPQIFKMQYLHKY